MNSKHCKKKSRNPASSGEDELNELVEQNYLKAVDLRTSTFGKMLEFSKLGYQDDVTGNKIVMRSNTLLGKLVGIGGVGVKKIHLELKAMKSLQEGGTKMMNDLASKTGKFATGILKLLLTGGILFGLYKLLEWLSEQDPMELYNMAVGSLIISIKSMVDLLMVSPVWQDGCIWKTEISRWSW